MLDRIKSFLTAGSHNRDQAYAEAAIELLILAMYADGELTVAERQFLGEYGDLLPWHGTASKDLFIAAAYGRVREVHASKQRKAFISTMAARLPKADDRLKLFSACNRLFKADGTMPIAEKEFLADVKAGFALT